ncbi:MAG: hypothetical protein KAI25_07805 [Hyphomicrobiaceae bacterium]|nr:hypothetical protein [Hyphomicrobiaceae bacterium]
MSLPTQDSSRSGGPVVSVKPQANIYTVLLLVGLLSVTGAWVYCMMLLKDWYGVAFGSF